MTVHSVGNVIIPTDELTPSFFRGVGLNHQPELNGCSIAVFDDLMTRLCGDGLDMVGAFCEWRRLELTHH